MFESKLEGCTKTETFKHLAILVQLQVEIASAPPAPRPLQRSGWWLGFVGTVQHYQCSKEITLRKFTVFNCLTIIFYMNDMSLFSMSVRFCLDVYIIYFFLTFNVDVDWRDLRKKNVQIVCGWWIFDFCSVESCWFQDYSLQVRKRLYTPKI